MLSLPWAQARDEKMSIIMWALKQQLWMFLQLRIHL